jgi:hypothetical protein
MMAISLEELTVGLAEGMVGSLAFALGAGAVAVALAARPVGRIVTTGVSSLDSEVAGRPRRWIGSLGRGWRDLIDEARAEYEADRRSGSSSDPEAVIVNRTVDGSTAAVQAARGEASHESVEAAEVTRKRDARGRFQRRSPNGAAPA